MPGDYLYKISGDIVDFYIIGIGIAIYYYGLMSRVIINRILAILYILHSGT